MNKYIYICLYVHTHTYIDVYIYMLICILFTYIFIYTYMPHRAYHGCCYSNFTHLHSPDIDLKLRSVIENVI